MLRKTFESTGDVRGAKTKEGIREFGESPPHGTTANPLRNDYGGVLQPPAPDDHLRATIHEGKQRADFRKRHREIGIREEPEAAMSRQHALAHGKPLSPVCLARENDGPRDAAQKFAKQYSRTIRAAIVHENPFVFKYPSPAKLMQLFEESGDILFFIEQWNDDGKRPHSTKVP